MVVARPKSKSRDQEEEEREEVPKKAMKKSLSSRLGPVEGAEAQFTEKEIYEEMLRQQERRRLAIEEKEIKKLKKAMKKKEKLEKKLKKEDKKEKKKRGKKVREDEDDSDFSEGEMLVGFPSDQIHSTC